MDEPENELSARQMAQYASLELIVENFGMFTKDSSPDGSHYMSGDENPFIEEGLACYNCVFWQENNACEIVQGTIEPEALCKLWIIPEVLLDEEMHKASYTPPDGVRSAARQALKWIADGHAGDGFTATGRYRAETLAAGRAVSLDTIKRMNSFFARHEVDKQGEGWDRSSDKFPSAGRVAWAAWGGDAGWSWAKGILSDMEKAKTFSGNRSAAGQYAAQMRWRSRGRSDTTDGKTASDLIAEGKPAIISEQEVPALIDAMLVGDGQQNLRNLTVTGTPYFGSSDTLMNRSEMPQVPSGRKQEFLSAVEKQGLTVERKEMSPRDLKPTQADINGKSASEIRGREGARGNDAFKTGDNLSIVVSSDGYIMDGHHRWAGAALHEMSGTPTKMSVIQIGAPKNELIGIMQKWTDAAGVKRLGFAEHRVPVGKVLAFKKACEIGLQAQKEYINGTN